MKPSLKGMSSRAGNRWDAGRLREETAPAQAMAAAPRVGVIRNPKSHYNRKSEPERIDLPHVLRLAPSGRPEIARALAEFARQGIDLLVIDGGDGTVRDVLTEGASVFGNDWPRIIILPSGKTNALALDLGMPKGIGLGDALRIAGHARIATRKPIRVERGEDGGKQLMGFLLGAGVFNAAIDAGQVAHRLGAFQSTAVGVAAMFGILQALAGFGDGPWRRTSPIRMTLGREGREMPCGEYAQEGRRYGLVITTLQNFPLGMKPFGGPADDLRYLVWDKPLRRLIALAPAILMGWEPTFLRRLGLFRGSAEEIGLAIEGNFILDGEAFPAGKIRVLPGHEIQFLVP